MPGLVLWSRYGSDCGVGETISALRRAAESRNGVNETDAQIQEIGRDGGLVRLRTPIGEWWAPAEDGAGQVIYEAQRHPYKGLVRKADVVLDVGAHIGTFSKQALADGAKLVVAVEASP